MTTQSAHAGRVAEVTLLTQPDCVMCDQAKTVLARLVDESLVTFREVDVAEPEGRDLAIRHGVLFAPGVFVDGQPFSYGRLSEKKLRRQLGRDTTAEQVPSAGPVAPFSKGPYC